ncbi:hypothetical protein SG34_002535 [Thalassomonas viridans]|uniref:Uncharacterized protein n=1 Tax=Thalassomonas viridans TaxID=137584 RepID=A0AAE9Z2Z6_9GAMM|nr:hypothetical protein [Thalassomonas viridans]WDE05831.1 hypothetical protein SG34_002535 [Thalassomonas viridans]
MAKANDMPEFHSVKVFVTENTPPRRRHGFTNISNISNISNAGITSPHGFAGCSTASCFIAGHSQLTLAGGQAHV